MADSTAMCSLLQCLLHSCKNSHVCGASGHETVIHFVLDGTTPPLTPSTRLGSFHASVGVGEAALEHFYTHRPRPPFRRRCRLPIAEFIPPGLLKLAS